MTIDLVKIVTEFVNQAGVTGLMVAAILLLLYYIRHNTAPRELVDCLQKQADKQDAEIQDLRHEWKETVGPSLVRIGDLQERQLELMEQTLRHVNELEDRFDEHYRLDLPQGGRRGRRDD